MERLKRTENIVVKSGKIDKIRSRKPRKIKFVKKAEPT